MAKGNYVLQGKKFSEYTLGENMPDPCTLMIGADCTATVLDYGGTTTSDVPFKAGIPYPYQFKKITATSNSTKVYINYND
jgi:hypothetical protein